MRTKMSRIPNTGWDKTLLCTTALKWAVLWFAYDMLPLEVGEEGTRQLTSRHRGSGSSEETAPATSIYLFNMIRIKQCWGSVTNGSGSDSFLH
jgi:hypothetical protein